MKTWRFKLKKINIYVVLNVSCDEYRALFRVIIEGITELKSIIIILYGVLNNDRVV